MKEPVIIDVRKLNSLDPLEQEIKLEKARDISSMLDFVFSDITVRRISFDSADVLNFSLHLEGLKK